MTFNLSDIKALSKPGIYRLVNHEKKSCYISYSSNLLIALSKDLIYNYSNFEVLEIVTDLTLIKLRCQFWKDQHESSNFKDYELINPKRVCGLKLSIEAQKDFRYQNTDRMLFHIKVVYRNYMSKLVGIFSEYSEVEEFIARFYSNGIYNIVYSSNELTGEYLKLNEL